MTKRRSPTADAITRAVDRLERALAPEPIDRLFPVPPAREPVIVQAHQLHVEHLGRWVLIPPPGRFDVDTDPIADTATTTAGRLVGLRPGENTSRSSRVLVVQQGGQSAPIDVLLTSPVHVAPRSWS